VNGIEVSTTSQNAINILISFGIPALATLIFAILGIVGLTELVARVRAVSSKIRKYVDDPKDPAIIAIHLLAEKVTKSQVDEEDLLKIIDKVLAEMSKPQS
jgi:hypothetical protein